MPIFYIDDPFANYVVLERENTIKEQQYYEKTMFIERILKKIDSALENLKKTYGE